MNMKELVYQLIYINGALDHRLLQRKLDCGYHAVNDVLKELCKEGKLRHEEIYPKKGYKMQHLFYLA